MRPSKKHKQSAPLVGITAPVQGKAELMNTLPGQPLRTSTEPPRADNHW